MVYFSFFSDLNFYCRRNLTTALEKRMEKAGTRLSTENLILVNGRNLSLMALVI